MTTIRTFASFPGVTSHPYPTSKLNASWHASYKNEIQELDFSGSLRLEDLSKLNLADYPYLKRLNLRDCIHLTDLSPLQKLEHLEEVDCRGSVSLPPHLQTLLIRKEEPHLFENWKLYQSHSALIDASRLV